MSIRLRDGSFMPIPGFGTWRCDEAKLEDAVYHALKIGYRHLDCAQLYKNEHIVGRAIRRALADGVVASRAELWITGKLAPSQMQPESVEPAIRKTLESLFGGLDASAAYLDLFITHWPYGIDPDCTTSPAPFVQRRGYSPSAYLSVWRAMEAAVDAGTVRRLGCSNMTSRKLHALCAAARVQPVNVQAELHPCLAQAGLVASCAARGIVLTGYSPLGSPGRPAAYRAAGDPDVLSHPALVAVAARLGRSPAQVALRWAVQRGTVPLPRSTTLERVDENRAGALGLVDGSTGAWSLSTDDLAEIARADAGALSGRIMKGDNFAAEGEPWQAVWDADWRDPAIEPASAGGGGATTS